MAFGHASFFSMHFNEARTLGARGGNWRHTAQESKTYTPTKGVLRLQGQKGNSTWPLISLHPQQQMCIQKLHVTRQCHQWGYFKPKEAFLIIQMKWYEKLRNAQNPHLGSIYGHIQPILWLLHMLVFLAHRFCRNQNISLPRPQLPLHHTAVALHRT